MRVFDCAIEAAHAAASEIEERVLSKKEDIRKGASDITMIMACLNGIYDLADDIETLLHGVLKISEAEFIGEKEIARFEEIVEAYDRVAELYGKPKWIKESNE